MLRCAPCFRPAHCLQQNACRQGAAGPTCERCLQAQEDPAGKGESDIHYSEVMMSAMASQITSVPIVCSNVCSGSGQRKHQSSASLAFVRGIHRWPVDSPHKGQLRGKCFHLMTSSCYANCHVDHIMHTTIKIKYSWQTYDGTNR